MRDKISVSQDGKVKPHPSSVNSFVGAFPFRWLVYNQKVKSSDIFIRDSSCISDYALLLFGGALERGEVFHPELQ